MLRLLAQFDCFQQQFVGRRTLLPDALPRSSMALPRRAPEARRACNKCAHLTQNHIGLALTNARCHTQGERSSICGCIQSEFGRDLEFRSTLYSRLQSQAVVFCRGAKPLNPVPPLVLHNSLALGQGAQSRAARNRSLALRRRSQKPPPTILLCPQPARVCTRSTDSRMFT